MKNEIIRITNEEKNDLLESLDKTSCFVVEIDGSEISTVNDLFDVMEQKYDLNTSDGTWGRNWAAFKDLMTDLEWIDSKKHVLIIDDFK
ncbi:MAG: barstar family protein, partial [Ruminococcus sp.]|nr:barstar family protein [Ruminococcus sp.]